eukprot:6491958-Amphidinium_carterae.2
MWHPHSQLPMHVQAAQTPPTAPAVQPVSVVPPPPLDPPVIPGPPAASASEASLPLAAQPVAASSPSATVGPAVGAPELSPTLMDTLPDQLTLMQLLAPQLPVFGPMAA